MPFRDWIASKYNYWRKDRYGREGSIEAYALFIGVPGNVMREWIKRGKEPKHKKFIDPLIAQYGPEVYEVLGIEPPDDYLSQFISFKVAPHQREAVNRGIALGLAHNMANGIDDPDVALINILSCIIEELRQQEDG